MATSRFPFWALTTSLLVAGTGLAPRPAGPTLPRAGQELYRRYRGQVAGRPVLVEFALRRLGGMPKEFQLDLAGSSYDLATGELHTLHPAGLFMPAAPLTLTEEADSAGHPGPMWRATQPLGPVLSGTWQASPQAPAQPFALREDYTGGVRYELLTETTTGKRGLTNNGDPARASIEATYLHLLGPDTLRPALARLQCPVPVHRRRARRAQDQVSSPQDFATFTNQSIDVTLNEQDLLAYGTYTVEGVIDLRHAQHTWENVVYDLQTGRQVELLALLRPGGEEVVQRLITRQLRHGDPTYAAELSLATQLLPLPDAGFALTPTGWQATYQTTPEDEPNYSYTVTLTWAQLRPLLGANTPLNRLLVARGLAPAEPAQKGLPVAGHLPTRQPGRRLAVGAAEVNGTFRDARGREFKLLAVGAGKVQVAYQPHPTPFASRLVPTGQALIRADSAIYTAQVGGCPLHFYFVRAGTLRVQAPGCSAKGEANLAGTYQKVSSLKPLL